MSRQNGHTAGIPPAPPVRAYQQIYRHLRAAQHTDDMLLIAAFVNVLLVLCVYLFMRPAGMQAALTAAFIASTLWFGISASALALWRSAGIGNPDGKLLDAALAFLAHADWDAAVLDTVARRAEISQSRAQSRNLVALLILPIVVSAFSTARGVGFGAWSTAGLIILMLLVPLVQEAFSNSIDTIIRHAVAEQLHIRRTSAPTGALPGKLLDHEASHIYEEHHS
ncbi:MAG TPA: hypothetical protein PKA05_07570 [Roseiflexaceae bacterium]|nr:hypothetical protein [Roseiflexaceae bacterium]HMP40222.1 hypothetical protein [Roseiflexaceae bacterium]